MDQTSPFFDRFFCKVGQSVLKNVRYVSGAVSLFFYSIIKLFKPKRYGRYYTRTILTAQVYFTAVKALRIISIIGLFFGVTIVFVVMMLGANLPMFAPEDVLPGLLILIFIRELGPLLTAILVVARSGTAITTEIGNMIVNKETEALESLGIDTLNFITLPRILGMIVSLILLNVYFNIATTFGGVLTAVLMDSKVSISSILGNFLFSINILDVLEFMIKSVFFAGGISTICLMAAFMEVRGESRLVPYAATIGVVNALIYVFFMNAFLTVLFVLINPITL